MYPFNIISGDDIAIMEREFRRTFINSLSGFRSIDLVETVSSVGPIGEIVEVRVVPGAVGAHGFLDLEKTSALAGSGLEVSGIIGRQAGKIRNEMVTYS